MEPRLPDWPRGLREDLAAAYVGLSASTFTAQVRAGEIPGAVQLTRGRKVWLRDDLDRYLDRKAGRIVDSGENPWLTAFGDGSGESAVPANLSRPR